ncbi:MAG: hypothetical protein KDK61_01480, partial [Simkania sp.]|nr:hypothetical protein [Simkania sp.]
MPQDDDVDWFTTLMMLSEEDYQKQKSEIFDHESGPIAQAISSGNYEKVRFREYQTIIERAVELGGMGRGFFPTQTGDRIKLVSEEMIQKWNRNYRAHWDLPRDEPGHLSLQYRNVKMHEGPGSLKELELLREAASKLLEDDRLTTLTNNPETLKDELSQVFNVLKEKGLVDDEIKIRLLDSIDFLKETAFLSQTGRIMPGYGDLDDVFMEYFEKTSFIFSVVPVLIEGIFRSIKPSEVIQGDVVDNGLVVETETSIQFELDKGLGFYERKQISFAKGVDGLAYFREDPSRVIAVFRRSHEMNLPLGYDIRLAIILFRKEFQQWMDSNREKDSKSELL